jgi:hypothetical protein
VPAAADDDEFRSRWLIIPIEAMLHDGAAGAPQMIMEVVTGDEAVIIEIGAGEVRARTVSELRPGASERRSDLVVTGPPKAVMGVLSGKLTLPAAERFGVRLEGDRGVLARVGLT